MGGYQSKLETTNWETANGGLLKPKDTVDVRAPSSKSTTIKVTKQGMINSREFDIKNDQGDKVYSTKVVPGTIRCFDLLAVDDEAVIRVVRTSKFNRSWEVYRFEKPLWDSQAKDEKASKKASQPLYRVGKIGFDLLQKSGLYYPYEESSDDDASGVLASTAVLRVETIKSFKASFKLCSPRKKSLLGIGLGRTPRP